MRAIARNGDAMAIDKANGDAIQLLLVGIAIALVALLIFGFVFAKATRDDRSDTGPDEK
jgi:hypothetical protein